MQTFLTLGFSFYATLAATAALLKKQKPHASDTAE
jgi:hypothetical protein